MTQDEIKAEMAAIEAQAVQVMDNLNPAAQAILAKAFDGEMSWDDAERLMKEADPDFAAYKNRSRQ